MFEALASRHRTVLQLLGGEDEGGGLGGGEGLELATTAAAAVAFTANRYCTPSATARHHSGQSGTTMAYGTGRDILFNNYTLTLSPLIEKVKYGTRIKYVFTMELY
jgi:hypothetical protein